MGRLENIVEAGVLDGVRKFGKKGKRTPAAGPFARLIVITQEINRDVPDVQVIIKFLFECGIPTTFAELGMEKTEETMRFVAKRIVARGYKRKGYKCDEQDLYIQIRKINSWGEKITGIRGPKQVAGDLAKARPDWVSGIKKLKKSRIVFLGDSLMTTLHWGANAGYPDIIMELCRKYNKKVEIINAGIGGNTSWQGMDRLDRDVISKKPKYCVVLFGGNDLFGTQGGKDMKPMARFRSTMHAMIKKLKKHGITPVLLSGTIIRPFNRDLYEKEVVSVQKSLAKTYKLDLIDTYDVMKYSDTEKWLCPDQVHLNDIGQANMAGTVLKWMFRHI